MEFVTPRNKPRLHLMALCAEENMRYGGSISRVSDLRSADLSSILGRGKLLRNNLEQVGHLRLLRGVVV